MLQVRAPLTPRQPLRSAHKAAALSFGASRGSAEEGETGEGETGEGQTISKPT